MKKQISICFDFKAVGHAYITIFTPDYAPYRQDTPGCHVFLLTPGEYVFRGEGNVEIEGASISVKDEADNQLSNVSLGVGYFSKTAMFTVS